MVKPSKKGAKSENEVFAEAKKKKEILDKVAQSNQPTKTVLKELGISRSTYYSWLKRYEEEGEQGLLDSRSSSKVEEEIEESAPPDEELETHPTVKMKPEDLAAEMSLEAANEEVKEEEPPFPAPEESGAEYPETAASPAVGQPESRGEVSPAKEDVSFGGGQGRKGFGAYAVIAVVVLVLGLLFSLSLSNYSSYTLKESSNILTLWKGKFAPRGYEMVESFDPVSVGDTDVSELTSKTYTSKAAVNESLFTFFMDQANVEVAKGDEADIGKIDIFLDKAESLMSSDMKSKAAVTNMRFQLVKQRVGMAEVAMQKAYREALPVYEEALKGGLGDSVALESKIEAMKKALELGPAVAPEQPGKDSGETPAEIEKEKEAETAIPVATEAQKTETSVAPKEKEEEAAGEGVAAPGAAGTETIETETQESEAEVDKAPTKKDETVSEEPESGEIDKSGESEEKAEKPTSFMEWVRSKRPQQ